MNLKSHFGLWFLIVAIFSIPNQQTCKAVSRRLYTNQENLVRQVDNKIARQAEVFNAARKEILSETNKRIARIADQPDSPLAPVKKDIERLLQKEEVSAEEIAMLRERLMTVRVGPGIDKAEYDRLRDHLDIAYQFMKPVAELEQSCRETVRNLNDNFDQLADDNEKISSWLKTSLFANIVTILGLVVNVGNILSGQVDRQLKKLQITEKKAELKHKGIDIKKDMRR